MNARFTIIFGLAAGLSAGLPLAQDSSEACSVCHRNHYQQWLQSPHAAAWKSESFQAQMKTFGNPDFCGRCHAPRSIWTQVNMRTGEGELESGLAADDYRPKLGPRRRARMETLEDGVNCGSCHFVEVLWPWGTANETLGPYHTERGHGGKPVPSFDSFELCGACHGRPAEDYRPSGLSAEAAFYHNEAEPFQFASGKIDCTVCHMPSSEDRLATLRVFRDLPARTVREHSFIGNRYQLLGERLDFALENAGGAVLMVSNRGVGHPVRVKQSTMLQLEVRLIHNGRPNGEVTIDFPMAPELGLGESRPIPLGFSPEKGDTVLVELVRKGPKDFREKLVEKSFVWE